ncbi:hypothetical protein BH09PLA1_BH09PLA1_33130 [soil metagenome]
MPGMSSRYSVGFVFGAESVRAMIVNVRDGAVAARTSRASALVEAHPPDLKNAATSVCREAIELAQIAPEQVVGIGVALAQGSTSAMLVDLYRSDGAAFFGLRAGLPIYPIVSAAHAIVPGAGVASPSTMVMVIGAGTHLLMNSRIKAAVPGEITVVEHGILPGYIGYEAKQASVGEALDRVAAKYGRSHEDLARQAGALAPGSGGFLGALTPADAAHAYRATIEATAFELRQICDTLRDAGVPVRRFVAAGALPRKNPLLMQVYADVLDARIRPAASEEPVALGAAILGALAAGQEATGHASISQTTHAMAPRQHELLYRPDLRARKLYDDLYKVYRQRALSDDA